MNIIVNDQCTVELRLNMVIAKNPHLINSLIGYTNNSLNRNFSHIPVFN